MSSSCPRDKKNSLTYIKFKNYKFLEANETLCSLAFSVGNVSLSSYIKSLIISLRQTTKPKPRTKRNPRPTCSSKTSCSHSLEQCGAPLPVWAEQEQCRKKGRGTCSTSWMHHWGGAMIIAQDMLHSYHSRLHILCHDFVISFFWKADQVLCSALALQRKKLNWCCVIRKGEREVKFLVLCVCFKIFLIILNIFSKLR